MTQLLAVLVLSILLAVLVAAVAAYASRRARDRCLKGFDGDYVTIEFKDGTRAFGRLHVFADGLELRYDRPRQRNGHAETSLVLFEDGIRDIQTIRRYGEELVEWRRHARQRGIEDAYHPLPWVRWLRHARNGCNALRDAFTQMLGALFQLQLRRGQGAPPSAAEAEPNLPHAAQAHAYEPILERYLGRRVVVEEHRAGGAAAHAGVLLDYTAHWLQLVDCRQTREHYLPLAEVERLRLCRDLRVSVNLRERGGEVVLELDFRNLGDRPCVLRALVGDGYEHPLGVEVAPGDGVRCQVGDLPRSLLAPANGHPAATGNGEDGASLPTLALVVDAQRRTDLCLPRGVAVVRHGSEDVA